MDTAEQVTLMDGRLHVYRRENSRFFQCSTFLGGRNQRATTKEDNIALAKEFAADWYAERLVEDKRRRRDERLGINEETTGLPVDRRRRKKPNGPTFGDAAAQFMKEFEAIAAADRSPIYVQGHRNRLRVHLLPFLGDKALQDITPGLVQEYRIHRMTSRKDPKTGEPKRPAKNTLHQEIVCLRQTLKCANRHGWLPYLPDLSAPFRGSGKISHRAWFSPVEYKQLYTATQRRVKNPPKPRWRRSCEQLHDFVLFMANTGLRPDEAKRLEFRDVSVVKDDATGQRILEIEVRGKRGVGYCKSMPGAVFPFERLRSRPRIDAAAEPGPKPRMVKPKPTDRLFDMTHHELFNTILDEEGLKFDRDGNRRTAYSLRHTYICLRLMEGADIYQIAKNCRTSVEMIEKYYASHLKNTLDAAAINVRKPKVKNIKKKERADNS
jgi:integrase